MSAIESTKGGRLPAYWLIAGAIGVLVGAAVAMAVWKPTLPNERSLAPLVLPALPVFAVAIAQAAVLYRVAPKLLMAIAWILATLALFALAQLISLLSFISASSLTPTQTTFYFAMWTIPGAALLGLMQRELLKTWQLRPTYWIVATVVGNVAGAYLLLVLGMAIEAAGADGVLACCKYHDRLSVTLAGPIILSIAVLQAFSFCRLRSR